MPKRTIQGKGGIKMKTITLTIALILLTATASYSTTGFKYVEGRDSGNKAKAMLMVGVAIGTYETLIWSEAIRAPHAFDLKKVILMLNDFLEKNPKELHEELALLLALIFFKEYPELNSDLFKRAFN